MVAADLGFFDSGSTALTTFGLQGHAAAPTRFDYFLAGPQNPLFSDVNGNGIDDAWETAHGLSLSGYNRDLSPGGNGVTVVRAYIAGLDPQDYYCGVAPVLRWQGANRQVRRPGGLVVLPMAVAILDAANGSPLSNAPITFSVGPADATLLASVNDAAGTAQLVVRADATGVARACLRLDPGWNGRITVKAGVSVGGAPGGALTYEVLPTVDSPGLACGGDQTLWLDGAGTARSWGCNSQGQLGDGTTLDRSQMRRLVSVPEALTSAAFGQAHGLAVTTKGRLVAWGDNYFGQLGDGTATSHRTPAAVNGLSGFVQVAAGDCHSLALCADGTVWAWGGNQSGQLGDGSRENRATPVRVSGLAYIVQIAAGARHGLALAADGTVWAWGSNEFGQLGDATVADRPTPAAVSGVDGVVALASGRQHILALRADGTVWAWGDNHAGQLGLGSARGQTAPQRIPTLPFATGLAAGSNHSAALAADGTFWTWGANDVGQLGNGGDGPALAPAMLALTEVREFASGWDHVVVLGSDGSLLAWGLNRHDQLGSEGAGGFSNIPVRVASPVD
jgi:alpha-tubulin suppressor-like RCC1 family protein